MSELFPYDQLPISTVHDLSDKIERTTELIGRGGYGSVYKGRWLDAATNPTPATIVIKIIDLVPLRDEAERTRRFKQITRELSLWCSIQHENILPLLGIVRINGDTNIPAFVCPWMENGNAKEFCSRNPHFPPMLILYDIINGLHYLHTSQPEIVHGDIKAASFITETRFLTDNTLWKTTATHAAGTVRWMAPELVNEDATTPTKESDIYAYAMTCYEILSGDVPFKSVTNDMAIPSKVMKGQRPNRIESFHSDSMWDIITRCWEQEPEGRLPTETVLELLQPTVYWKIYWKKEVEEAQAKIGEKDVALAKVGKEMAVLKEQMAEAMAKTEDNLKALKEEKEKTYEFETKITIQTEEIKRLQTILEKHDQLLQDKTAKPSSGRHAADALSLANSNWIWTDSGYMTVNPFVTADFRRDLTSPAGKTAVSSQIIITADNIYTLYVNGEYIGHGNDWTVSQQYCVKLNPSDNVFAVAVENEEIGPNDTTPNPAAFIAAIQINYSDGTSGTIVTDNQWLCNVATPGFQSIRYKSYNDAGWKNAFVAGHVNSCPWRTPTGPNGPSSLSIAGSYWVWTNEVPPNSPMSVAPIGSRAFRKTINVAGGATVRTGTIIIDADDEYDLYINGNYIGSGSNWQTAQCWKFTLDYPTGDIVFAVNATNTGDQAGIIAAIALDVFDFSCSTTLFDITDGSWKYDLTVPPGFQQPDYNDASWPNVVVAGPYGVQPWGWVPTQDAN